MFFSFDNNLRIYGLITGTPWRDLGWTRDHPTEIRWHLNLYSSERSRRRGILKYQREYPQELLYIFEITLAELIAMSKYCPIDGKSNDRRVKPNALGMLRTWMKNS